MACLPISCKTNTLRMQHVSGRAFLWKTYGVCTDTYLVTLAGLSPLRAQVQIPEQPPHLVLERASPTDSGLG